jgi:hypothetical protein
MVRLDDKKKMVRLGVPCGTHMLIYIPFEPDKLPKHHRKVWWPKNRCNARSKPLSMPEGEQHQYQCYQPQLMAWTHEPTFFR